jgi:hypothetical protein
LRQLGVDACAFKAFLKDAESDDFHFNVFGTDLEEQKLYRYLM